MTETERAKKLATDHWTGYVQGVVCNHAFENRAYTHEEMIRLCRFHYETAAVHFYGHAIEDERGGMFRPSIGEPLTAEDVNAISRPCSACLDEKKCGGGLRTASGDCLHHRPNVLVRCEECSTEYCFVKVLTPIVCVNFRPRVADQQHPRKEGP